ncbi:MAG: SIS domain-containing protein [Bdellovibrionales bacterium]
MKQVEYRDPKTFAAKYMEEVLPVFNEYLTPKFTEIMTVLEQAYKTENTIYICGNGGSAGTANHMVNDFSKGSSAEGKRRMRVLGLSDNMSLLTAYANDCGYETVFTEQLKNLWRPGDVLIAISASGNSPNVVKAVEFARKNDGKVIGLVGFSGGKLLELSHHAIHFKSHNYGVCEDAQLMFSHLASQYMYQYILNKGVEQNYK